MITTKINLSRRQVIAFCLLLLNLQLDAANKNNKISCSPVKQFKTGKTSLDNTSMSIVSPPSVYFFTSDEWNSEERKLTIFSYNTITSVKDSIILKVPELITINILPTIAINENFLILIDDENSDSYRFSKTGNEYKFSNKISFPINCAITEVRFLKENVFLMSSIYNQQQDSKVFNTSLAVYDAEKDKSLNIIHPDLPCIGFSHLTNSWITTTDRLIALAYPCSYKIIFYDYNLNAVDSINFTDSEWRGLKDNKIPIETSTEKIHPKTLIEKLFLLQDTVSRIEKIFFVNNSTILVSSFCYKCGESKRRIDIWKFNKFKKPIITCLNEIIEYSDDDIIDINKLPININYPLNVEIKDNIIYNFNDEDFTPLNKSKVSEYNHLKDQYYEKHNPQFTINLYKINLP